MTVSSDGLVVVDKPAGLTSHDVVARVRRLAGTRKVGHAGTLDPMATGVLVLGVERATRLLTYLVGADKTYAATIRLGVATVTDDAEGEVTARLGTDDVSQDGVDAGVLALTGAIEQVPSSVSAIKVDGRRAYARVRAGEQVELAARAVQVYRFDVLDRRAGLAEGVPVLDLDVEVSCSTGTYIRALARDLGVALGVGGHLTVLRRTAVGPYSLACARTLAQLEETFSVLPIAEAAGGLLPTRHLTDEEVQAVLHGRRVAPVAGQSGDVAALAPHGELVAVLTCDAEWARPSVVFGAR